MHTKLEHFGKALKEMLLKEVSENNNKIDDKLTQVINESRSYAETVKNVKESAANPSIPETSVDFRTLMKEARDEELAEEGEQKRRVCNIILHGVKEPDSSDKGEAKKMDETFVASFIESLKISTTCKSIVRIGTDPTKKRPIKLVMKCEEDKNKIMSSLGNLKDQENFRGLSVTDDYTQKQRETIKEWLDKAKHKNSEETPISPYIWRARGTPKNGMFLKKLLKRRPTVPQQ